MISMQEWKEEYVELLRKRGTLVVGVGVTAFNRIGPALVNPDYTIRPEPEDILEILKSHRMK